MNKSIVSTLVAFLIFTGLSSVRNGEIKTTSDLHLGPPVDREQFDAVELRGRSGFQRAEPDQFCAIS